jgi:hypothetical protein
MRIIGGKYKGRFFDVPDGFSARPTTDFAKEALFDILGNEYEFDDLKVLDLFGGSGSISFEFVSRGVGKVWTVEMNPKYASAISVCARRFGMDNLVVVRHNVFDFLPICKECFDLIFADPPYSMEGLDTIPDKVLSLNLLHEGCYFILEHGGEYSFRSHARFVKERVYGRVHFSFFV